MDIEGIDILCKILTQRIPPEQFQLHGTEVMFIDPDRNNKPVNSPNESPYNTVENQAIVADVIKNYDTLAVEQVRQIDVDKDCEAKIQATLREMAIAELQKEGTLPSDYKDLLVK